MKRGDICKVVETMPVGDVWDSRAKAPRKQQQIKLRYLREHSGSATYGWTNSDYVKPTGGEADQRVITELTKKFYIEDSSDDEELEDTDDRMTILLEDSPAPPVPSSPTPGSAASMAAAEEKKRREKAQQYVDFDHVEEEKQLIQRMALYRGFQAELQSQKSKLETELSELETYLKNLRFTRLSSLEERAKKEGLPQNKIDHARSVHKDSEKKDKLKEYILQHKREAIAWVDAEIDKMSNELKKTRYLLHQNQSSSTAPLPFSQSAALNKPPAVLAAEKRRWKWASPPRRSMLLIQNSCPSTANTSRKPKSKPNG